MLFRRNVNRFSRSSWYADVFGNAIKIINTTGRVLADAKRKRAANSGQIPLTNRTQSQLVTVPRTTDLTLLTSRGE